MEIEDSRRSAMNLADSTSFTKNSGEQSKAENDLLPKLKCNDAQSIGLARYIELFLALVIALSTAVNLYVAYSQWNTMQESNKINREAFIAVQRPFVTAPEIVAKQDRGDWFFHVTVENSGNTPTKGMQYFVTYTENGDRDPEDVFSSSEADGRRFRGIIGPKAKIPLNSFVVGLPDVYIASLAEKRSDFYIYGVIHYNDLFSETFEHLTKFCFVGQPFKKEGVVDIGFMPCRYWNCADDDCDKEKREFQSVH